MSAPQKKLKLGRESRNRGRRSIRRKLNQSVVLSKHVYLYELDSVRDTREEILEAVKALCDEIVVYGNTVVLTYNQLVDSRLTFALVNDEESFQLFLSLFNHGFIQISPFKEIRSLSQYVMGSLDKALARTFPTYKFSALPLKSTQKSLLAMMKRCLVNNDLSEINEYILGKRNSSELGALFDEFDVPDSTHGGSATACENVVPRVVPSSISSMNEQLEILKQLRQYLKLFLRLSLVENLYAPCQDNSASRTTFLDYLGIVLRPNFSEAPSDFPRGASFIAENWNHAIEAIKEGQRRVGNSNNRSDWHKQLKINSESAPDKRPYAMAEAIVDLCYNYTCESSVYGVSKRYDIKEVQERDDGEDVPDFPTFQNDFLKRLNSEISGKIDSLDERYLQEENCYFTIDLDEQDYATIRKQLTVASQVVEISSRPGVSKLGSDSKESEGIPRYEKDLDIQHASRKKKVWNSFYKSVIAILSGVASLVFIMTVFKATLQLGIFLVERYYSTDAKEPLSLIEGGKFLVWDLLSNAVIFFLSLGLQFWLLKVFKKLRRAEDMLEVFNNILFYWRYRSYIKDQAKRAPYLGEDSAKTEPLEEFGKTKLADNIAPEIREYARLVKRGKEEAQKNTTQQKPVLARLFGNPSSDFCYALPQLVPDAPQNQTSDSLNAKLVKLTHISEMTGKKFGVRYESKFNTMIVDPVRTDGKTVNGDALIDEDLLAYERVFPTSMREGGVYIPCHNGKIVLIEQARHAIRSTQWCFPRGFCDPCFSPEANAIKELREEIHATFAIDQGSKEGNDALNKLCSCKDPEDSVVKEVMEFAQKLSDAKVVRKIGKITPDSGLAASVVDVFVIEIDHYETVNHPANDKTHEGILSTLEVTPEELEDKIKNKEINDGFTLSAYLLNKLQG